MSSGAYCATGGPRASSPSRSGATITRAPPDVSAEKTHTEQTPPPDDPRAGQGSSAFLVTVVGLRVGEMFKLAKDLTVVGRGEDADIRLLDKGISRRHTAVVRCGDKVLLKDLDSANGTYRNGERVWVPVFLEDGDKISIGGGTILKFTYQDELEERFNRSLYESATRDALTGLYNRRYFEERFAAELNFAVRHGAPLALMIVDVDDFKAINDERGQSAGDDVLRAIGRRLSATVRAEDVVARLGGDEFVVLCRETGQPGAAELAERLRRAIADEPIGTGAPTVHVTASIGISVTLQDDFTDEEGLTKAADAALYEAKRQGRNRSVVFADESPTIGRKGR